MSELLVRNVSVTRGKPPKQILRIDELALGPGIHAIIGRTTSGKTLLLRAIAGQAKLSDGTVVKPPSALARTGDDVRLVGRKVADHFAVAAVGHETFNADTALGFLSGTGITGSSLIRSLSTRQRQMVSISVALAANTPVTLLDEPFSGLDPDLRTHLRERLTEISDERPDMILVLSSYSSEDVAGLTDSVMSIVRGTLEDPIDIGAIRREFPVLLGPDEEVREISRGLPVFSERRLGPLTQITVKGRLSKSAVRYANARNIEVSYLDDNTLINLQATGEKRSS